jgi:hypothetical protein
MTYTPHELTPQERRALADRLAAEGAGQIQSLMGMTAEQIDTAREEGRLAVLMGADPADVALTYRARNGGTIAAPELDRLKSLHLYDEIVAAHTEGRITDTEENR